MAKEKASEFKVVKQLTLPVFSLKEEGNGGVFRVIDAIRPVGSQRANFDSPMLCVPVEEVRTGECMHLVANKVIKDALESYPDNGYVGRVFDITCLGVPKGKRHRNYRIMEVEAK